MKLSDYAFFYKWNMPPSMVLTSFVKFEGRRTLIAMNLNRNPEQISDMIWDLGMSPITPEIISVPNKDNDEDTDYISW